MTLEKNITELIEILSCGDAEPDQIKEMLPPLELALKDPKKYLEENPDDAWLATGYNLDELNIALNESIFAWRLSTELGDFSVVGDKGDEIFDGVVDELAAMDIEIDQPEDVLENWFEYAEFIEQQLVKNKTGKKVIALDINFSDDVSVFVIERDKADRLKTFLDYFNLNVVQA